MINDTLIEEIDSAYRRLSTGLRRRYPQASVHTFHSAGHTPWMSHKEEYLSVIKEFLDQQ
jgi:pimeloyl-ACP methyl ester carboxylesterase